MQDLKVASPATVSRCGMVFVDPEELKWMPYVKTWMKRIKRKVSTTINSPISQFVKAHISLKSSNCNDKPSLCLTEGILRFPLPNNSWDPPEIFIYSPILSLLFVVSACQSA